MLGWTRGASKPQTTTTAVGTTFFQIATNAKKGGNELNDEKKTIARRPDDCVSAGSQGHRVTKFT